MKREILIDSLMGETRLAVLEDGELMELHHERRGQEKLSGNIYEGRVENVLPGMNAAFVDIGLEKNAFLYAGDILLDTRGDASLERQMENQRIERMVKKGQQIIVQVVKEPGGSKGPRISCHITVPGRNLVLLPTVRYAGVSKKIEEDAARDRLWSIADRLCRENGMGLIVRTAAKDVSEEELADEYALLVKVWRSVEQRGNHVKAPALLRTDDSLVERAVRDMLDENTAVIRTQDPKIAERLRETAAALAPEYADRIELFKGELPLFDVFRVESQADKALERWVWLKSGGSLIIDYAEALTVIDVNTGKFTGKKDLSETVYRTNCEAAAEIARQLRLRDIGGIVIVDFIDMDRPEQKQSLLEILREEMKKDRSRTRVVGITELGLVEITRKKERQPLHLQITHHCDLCGGTGRVPEYETAARKILRDLYRRRNGGLMLVEAPAEAATVLLGIGAPEGVQAFVLPDAARHGMDYEISPADRQSMPQHARELKRGRED